MLGRIRKIKDINEEYAYPITVGEAVYVESNKNLNQKLSEIDAQTSNINSQISSINNELDTIGDGGGTGINVTTEIITHNLYSIEEEQTGGYYSNTTGVWTNSAFYKSSGKISCAANDAINTSPCTVVAFFTASDVFVSGLSVSGTAFTVPNDATIAKVAITYNSGSTNILVTKNLGTIPVYVPHTVTKLYNVFSSYICGKKWNALGDSTTFASGQKSYMAWVSEETGVIPMNYGVMSTTIAKRDGRTDSMLERYVAMTDNADIITVLGGTNDFGMGVPIGTISDTGDTTFYGAYKQLLAGLINKYPTKTIGTITPVPRRGCHTSMQPWVNAIKEVSAMYKVPCLDLFNSGGLNPDIDYINNNYFVIQDGLHPNSTGYQLIAKHIRGFLESIV